MSYQGAGVSADGPKKKKKKRHQRKSSAGINFNYNNNSATVLDDTGPTFNLVRGHRKTESVPHVVVHSVNGHSRTNSNASSDGRSSTSSKISTTAGLLFGQAKEVASPPTAAVTMSHSVSAGDLKTQLPVSAAGKQRVRRSLDLAQAKKVKNALPPQQRKPKNKKPGVSSHDFKGHSLQNGREAHNGIENGDSTSHNFFNGHSPHYVDVNKASLINGNDSSVQTCRSNGLDISHSSTMTYDRN